MSPYTILTPESLKVTRMKKWSPTKEALVYFIKSPCQPLGKCIENSTKNTYTDQLGCIGWYRVSTFWEAVEESGCGETFLLTAHMMSLDLSAYIILMIIRAFLSCNRKVYYIGQVHWIFKVISFLFSTTVDRMIFRFRLDLKSFEFATVNDFFDNPSGCGSHH